MSKSKHETTGMTPDPKSRRKGEEGKQKVEMDTSDPPLKGGPMSSIALDELQAAMISSKTQTTFLMAQHAGSLREETKREIALEDGVVSRQTQAMLKISRASWKVRRNPRNVSSKISPRRQGSQISTIKTGDFHTRRKEMHCRL